jgi:hypothetical protein
MSREELKVVADELDQMLSIRQKLCGDIVNFVINQYATANWDDYDISKMDKSVGGEYFYSGFGEQYIRDSEGVGDNKVMVYSSGNITVTDQMKKEMLWLEKVIGSKFMELFKDITFKTPLEIMLIEHDLGVQYPGSDVLSLLPWPQDFAKMDWYPYILSIKEPTWFPPTIGYHHGVNIATVMGIYANDKTPLGIATFPYKLPDMLKSLIKDQTKILFFAVKDTLTVLGATQEAKKVLKFKVLDDYDYLERMKDIGLDALNIPVDYELTDKSQPPGMDKLSAVLTDDNIGKDMVSIQLPDGEYKVVIEKSTVHEFYIVELLK